MAFFRPTIKCFPIALQMMFIALCVLSISICKSAYAVDDADTGTHVIEGRVAEIAGTDAGIRLNSPGSPKKGDRVDLIYVTSTGMEIEVGIWEVTEEKNGLVWAKVVDSFTSPRQGLTARIWTRKPEAEITGDPPHPKIAQGTETTSTAPKDVKPPSPAASGAGGEDQVDIKEIQRTLRDLGYDPGPIDGIWGRKTMDAVIDFQVDRGLPVDGRPTRELLDTLKQAPRAQKSAGAGSPKALSAGASGTGPASSASMTNTRFPPEKQRWIDMTRSGNGQEIRKAARTIHRHYLDDPAMLRVVNEELLKGFKKNTRDRNYIDAMAWLCNVLGASGDRQYKATLDKVAREAPHRKLKKYAAKNAAKLR